MLTYILCNCPQSSDRDDDETTQGRASTDTSSPKVKDDVTASEKYGPAAYGPFNPSPSWGPGGGASAVPGQFPAGNNGQFSPNGLGQTKLPPISNAFHEKNNATAAQYARYVNSGIPNYAAYEYYMQCASQGGNLGGMFLGGNADNPLANAAPADLSTNRGKREEQRGMDGGVMGAGSGVMGAGGRVRNLLASPKVEDLSQDVMPSSLLLDDVAAMTSSFGQVPRNQDQFSRGAVGASQLSGMVSHGHSSLQTEAAHTGNNGGMGGPDQENLKRENDALKQAVRTLKAQMEHMKDQAYKD